MGTWSAEPVGNDAAADFVAELDGQKRWTVVKAAFMDAARAGRMLDGDVAATAIAAAEVVAHGLGRPSQTDAYTEGIKRFVNRARRPSRRLADRAVRAVELAARPDGELAELWAETGTTEWQEALARLVAHLERK
ncbi:DUF4259 domain-containing protein [Curtobacterium sp. 22159]|uniref:DUF4259 domain-containing protein n=1 Tax=Curtobacterium sp. 22159 TaxID=3453882 RepID=UPI003F84153B